MQLPENIQLAINRYFENVSPLSLRKAREALSRNYKEGGVSPFSDEARRLVYLGARMPATFAAVVKVLQNITLKGHLLDLGAGPGTATMAAMALFPDLEKITLVEQNREAIALGQSLFPLDHAAWLNQSLSQPLPKADAAILSYVIGELSSPEKVVENCWNAVDLLIIIEPGTPKAFQLMKKVRELLLKKEGQIVAPCPHALACPNDWCHFSARVERSRIHRLLKDGSLGHEDEKFCYLIVSKQRSTPCSNRIIRHPMKQTGHVRLSLCTKDGTLIEKTISRKDKATYRASRDAEWGDAL